MKVVDLNGEYSSWKITGHIPKANDKRLRSQYHLKARSLLKEIYPTCPILEEVPISIRRSETLFLDFYIPLHALCVEVHGEQHYSFVPHYHGNRLGFAKAKKRDREKLEWCEVNGITVVELSYKEDEDEWRTRLKN